MRKLLALILSLTMITVFPCTQAESTDVAGSKHQNIEYSTVNRISSNQTLAGTIESIGMNENAVLVISGNAAIKDAQISCSSEESTGGSEARDYGVGAAVLATDGTVDIMDSHITTRSNGGTGIFAYGPGVATASDCRIDTTGDAADGIQIAGGGTLFASELSVTTHGTTSAAVGSGANGGSMLINGGSYITYGNGSPAIFAAGEITVNSATLVANHSEALCLEGLNTVRLNDCVLSGNMDDPEHNGHSWTVAVYQPSSDRTAAGQSVFEMHGGTLNSETGDVFYVSNVKSVITLKDVMILKRDEAALVRCTGNDGTKGESWGEPGANGADCVLTTMDQNLNGNIIYDRISSLELYLSENTTYTGSIILEETPETDGDSGTCNVYVDDSSCWIVSGSSVINELHCSGIILDNEGKSVSIVGPDSLVYAEGTSSYTITVKQYDTVSDMSGANSIDRY